MNERVRELAVQVLETEAAAVVAVRSAIDERFEKAVRMILECRASVLTSGVGKAGHIARKIAATLSSTGTPSHFISATDAVHGDLGSVRTGDVVLLLSASGESDEILQLMSLVKKLNHPVIGITRSATSSLGRHTDAAICMGAFDEACPLGLAPSASTTAMLALGDALALTVMSLRKFTASDFAIYHPAGQLGRKLIRVREAMTFKLGDNLPVAPDTDTVGQVLHRVSSIKRRSGAVILTGSDGRISGIFSDGDLRRLVTDDQTDPMKNPVRDVMTRNPKRVHADRLASEAMAIMQQYRIDELPVVDDADKPLGLIDVQDLVVLRMLDVEPER